MEYVWVIATYPPYSEHGKSVLAHAEAGLGYVLQNKNRNKTDNVIVAFKYPEFKADNLPSSLTLANETQSERLEIKYGRAK